MHMKTMQFTKRFFSFVLFFSLLSAIALAQSSRSVSVKNFDGISVGSGIDLYLTQGAEESLTIKAGKNVIDNVVVEQKGGDINIRYKTKINWSILMDEQIKVYVSYKNLERLAASGGSDVYTQNPMKVNVLDLSASGGADVKLTLNCKNLSLSASGGADIYLKGNGENLSLSASGGADINAFGYVVNYAKVAVSGGADADIYVNKGLDAAASGGGDVNYKGTAVLKRTNSSKSGDVTHVK
ncbi:putative auto-transporter adhesin, head GIN domain [compost metagenome]